MASAARRTGIPVVAVSGHNTLSRHALHDAGIEAAYALTDLEPDPAVCMRDAAALLRRLGRRLARDLTEHPRTPIRTGALP